MSTIQISKELPNLKLCIYVDKEITKSSYSLSAMSRSELALIILELEYVLNKLKQKVSDEFSSIEMDDNNDSN